VPTTICPECEADVHVDTDTDKGDIVECDDCGAELEVVGLDPIELDLVEDDYFDEDDEYGDDDDY
jgi:lysine biosynthesis protein LysW